MYRTLGVEERRERSTTVTVLVEPELRARLELAAAASERSLGAEVRVALKRHLERNGNEMEEVRP